eukprot:TRINITY_DN18664_c0_g1_i1.p1 TRINITY_DN18664_c0_g1~~TRINITY_DN18664_c0_g1_i1.p1  ORF type:complete len:265 (+),score=45.82 TRINITY_DN18664_c0_g1_i1:88-882(+)
MLKLALTTLTFLAADVVTGLEIPWISFDGKDKTTAMDFKEYDSIKDFPWSTQCHGTWSDTDASGKQLGYGVMDGEVVNITHYMEFHKGQHPGYFHVLASSRYSYGLNDVSAVGSSGELVLKVRSKTPEYAGFRVAMFLAPPSGPSVDYSCSPNGGGNSPLTRGCFAARFSVPAGDEFSEVRIPFAHFSDKWDTITGDLKATCVDDTSTCITQQKLKLFGVHNIQFAAWGANGRVHLEVLSVSVIGSPEPAAALSGEAANENVIV